MKSPCKQPTLKDLRTSLSVLASLDIDIPEEIFVEISNQIREREKIKTVRRINRMSEEDLIDYANRQRTKLRVTLADGRMIQERNNGATFLSALKEVGTERLITTDYKIRRNLLIIKDESPRKRRFKNYVHLDEKIYVYLKTTAEEKKRILNYLDELYELNWDIEIL